MKKTRKTATGRALKLNPQSIAQNPFQRLDRDQLETVQGGPIRKLDPNIAWPA